MSRIHELIQNINRRFIGKQEQVELAVMTLLAKGHLLIEDVPGVGKTTLAYRMAKSLDLTFSRIQFTPDTMPGDVIGSSIYDIKSGEFRYIEGAIMSHVVLVDEINRTSPKTQASLLEAMEEQQVTVDKLCYKLPEPFVVIATQNPIDFVGTYPLPEAQLDRFLMQISIGYPSVEEEIRLSQVFMEGGLSEVISPVLTQEELIEMQHEVDQVKICDALLDYIVRLMDATRSSNQLLLGASPRATLAMIRSVRACAYLEGRQYGIPDDVKKVLPFVLSHRLIPSVEARMNDTTVASILVDIMKRTKVPM